MEDKNRCGEIIEYADMVYQKKITAATASETLSNTYGNAPASNIMYFNIYACMMDGKVFKRTAGIDIIERGLAEIVSRYGKEKLQTALQSTAGHIVYLERIQKTSKSNLRKMVDNLAMQYAVNPPDYSTFAEDLLIEDDVEHIWLFQSNPKYADAYQTLVDAIQTRGTITWSFHSYANKIKKGERAYIWAAGKDAGIIAEGIFASNPIETEKASNVLMVVKDKKPSPFSVPISITNSLLDSVVLRTQLLTDRRTQRMAVLTYPGATSFVVTPEEDAVIQSIIHHTYSPEPAQEKILETQGTSQRRYWLYHPGKQAQLWPEMLEHGVLAIGWDALGDLSQYSSQEVIADALREQENSDGSYKNISLAAWEFVHGMQVGDVVYAKRGVDTIVGRGVITSGYIYNENRNEYRNTRDVIWTPIDGYLLDDQYPGKQLPQKTLTDITPYTAARKWLDAIFCDTFEADGEDVSPEDPIIPYDRSAFLSQVFMTGAEHDTLINLLRRKKNIILQGAPGVGKTFAAKRLAYSLMEMMDDSRIASIQFHQSYSYEDFIMGYRPQKEGFSLETGIFYNFCKKAEEDRENGKPYCFIIDEINRGNLSKIFGELMMLVEADKRGQSLQLLYRDEQFSIPENLYIIGMMNTADRGLAMLDYALRRRFCFFTMTPRFTHPGFVASLKKDGAADVLIRRITSKMEWLNQRIATDANLGPDFCIGHSFFCRYSPVEHWYKDIIHYEIKPLLEEYFIDEDREKVNTIISELLR